MMMLYRLRVLVPVCCQHLLFMCSSSKSGHLTPQRGLKDGSFQNENNETTNKKGEDLRSMVTGQGIIDEIHQISVLTDVKKMRRSGGSRAAAPPWTGRANNNSITTNTTIGTSSILNRSFWITDIHSKPHRWCWIVRSFLCVLFLFFVPLLSIVQYLQTYKMINYNGESYSLYPSTDSIPSATTIISSTSNSQMTDRPEGSTKPSLPISEQTTTLFPPYMFSTAANITQIEMDDDSREYRNHCRKLNPKYELITYDNDMSRRFVAKFYPEWLELYDSLDVPVMRADMWRYLILYHYGGVYLDCDIDCKRPIDEWGEIFGITVKENAAAVTGDGGVVGSTTTNRAKTKNGTTTIGAMVGIESRKLVRGSQHKKLQFTQWTMAGQPGHYIFYRTIELINETMTHIRSGGEPPGDAVYQTGPVVFSRAVVDFMIKHGRLKAEQIKNNPPDNHDILVDDPTLTIKSDILVNDLAILHEDAFAYRRMNLGEAKNDSHHTVYVRHKFKGSWKPKGWKTMTKKQVHEAVPKKTVDRSTIGGDKVVHVSGGARQPVRIIIANS